MNQRNLYICIVKISAPKSGYKNFFSKFSENLETFWIQDIFIVETTNLILHFRIGNKEICFSNHIVYIPCNLQVRLQGFLYNHLNYNTMEKKKSKCYWVVIETGVVYHSRKEAKQALGASNFDRMYRLREIDMIPKE